MKRCAPCRGLPRSRLRRQGWVFVNASAEEEEETGGGWLAGEPLEGLTRLARRLFNWLDGQTGQRPARRAPAAAGVKLARLIYRMLSAGVAYKSIGEHYYEERYRAHLVARLQKQAAHFGFHLTPQQSK
jgi:hypothetical protein